MPKRSAGQDDEPDREQDRAGRASPRTTCVSGCGSPGRRRRRGRRPGRDAERRGRDDRERPLRARDRGDPAEHRPEQRAGDRDRERLPDQRAAPSGQRRGDEPRERPRPRERAREPLQEACEVELPRFLGEAERHRRRGHARHADEHGRLDAPARGDDPARDRAEEAACRVGGRQHAGARLAEAELVGVVRQERRQRCEEEGVDEHDRPHEEQHPAHGAESYQRCPRPPASHREAPSEARLEAALLLAGRHAGASALAKTVPASAPLASASTPGVRSPLTTEATYRLRQVAMLTTPGAFSSRQLVLHQHAARITIASSSRGTSSRRRAGRRRACCRRRSSENASIGFATVPFEVRGLPAAAVAARLFAGGSVARPSRSAPCTSPARR